jgi:hypothetical protein
MQALTGRCITATPLLLRCTLHRAAAAAFDYTHAQAGLMFSAFGAIGVGALLSMRWLCQHFNDVQLIVGGLCFMLLSTAMFLVDSESNLGYATFVFSVGMQYGAAYPIGHTAVIGLFSKVVGKRPQGALMGTLSAHRFVTIMHKHASSVITAAASER